MQGVELCRPTTVCWESFFPKRAFSWKESSFCEAPLEKSYEKFLFFSFLLFFFFLGGIAARSMMNSTKKERLQMRRARFCYLLLIKVLKRKIFEAMREIRFFFFFETQLCKFEHKRIIDREVWKDQSSVRSTWEYYN